MKTAAVIAEFNPFHEGHAYLLSQVRQLSGADNIVIIMSGDYVQRGEPAVTDKYSRTQTALSCGADLVLELPAVFSLGSAANFAEGAVSVLDKLGCIDELWFGSEYGLIDDFVRLSQILLDEPELFSDTLREGLKKGVSFPKARITALETFLNAEHALANDISQLLSSPNNILGLEYCIALKKLDSNIQPRTLKRKGSSHTDDTLQDAFTSASSIRLALKENKLNELLTALPKRFHSQFSAGMGLVFADDFSHMLRYKIMCESAESLSSYQDISLDLARRIKQNENSFKSISDFISLIKSKNMTYSHISRSLFHILLNITQDDLKAAYDRDFVRVLGFNKHSSVMKQIKQHSSVLLCTRPAQITDPFYKKELFASNLYETVQSEKANRPFIHDFERKLIINS